jgi:hypothetical protein
MPTGYGVSGVFDKLFGGVGLQRGRNNKALITAGESLDFGGAVRQP